VLAAPDRIDLLGLKTAGIPREDEAWLDRRRVFVAVDERLIPCQAERACGCSRGHFALRAV
jgi:hypothetical protein